MSIRTGLVGGFRQCPYFIPYPKKGKTAKSETRVETRTENNDFEVKNNFLGIKMNFLRIQLDFVREGPFWIQNLSVGAKSRCPLCALLSSFIYF